MEKELKDIHSETEGKVSEAELAEENAEFKTSDTLPYRYRSD